MEGWNGEAAGVGRKADHAWEGVGPAAAAPTKS